MRENVGIVFFLRIEDDVGVSESTSWRYRCRANLSSILPTLCR